MTLEHLSEQALIEASRLQREAMTPEYLRAEAEKSARRLRVLVEAGEYTQARQLLSETRNLCLEAVSLEGAGS